MLRNLPILFFSVFILASCDNSAWNNPYPHHQGSENTLYTAFSERPKHLDLAKSYSSNEWLISNQIYEMPLQYNYRARPFKLETLAAKTMPEVKFFDKDWQQIPEDTDVSNIAYSVYKVQLREDLQYAPHPAFAKDSKGDYRYHHVSESDLDGVNMLKDFEHTGSRQCTAHDFAYQIKRLADPKVHSPVFGLLSEHILDMKSYADTLQKAYDSVDKSNGDVFIDLRDIDFKGVKVIDNHTYEITLAGHYPQFIYWLAMPFLAPIPWEAVKFYSQTPLQERNITLDWYPVGTGPYKLQENNPNLQMIMVKNPYWQGKADIDKIQFMLEKESIPYWNKFLQGYYDQSGVSTDSFDQALQAAGDNAGLTLTPALKAKDIQLKTSTLPSTYYWGFNMLDTTIGGLEAKQKYLREAISIAFDMEEYINIFLNGRGQTAMSPLPPGIFGFKNDSYNPVTHLRDTQNQQIKRQPIDTAKALLVKAGYQNGIDPKTNNPLVLYLDAPVSGGPDAQARFAWMRKQFDKLGINLVVRATQYNRFQEKMHNGDAQIFSWGWNADYPDPENFFFLLYGANGMVKHGGENAANYSSPAFDKLFEQMRIMPNSPKRQEVIDTLIKTVQEDAPWIFGIHPMMYSLNHGWLKNNLPHPMARNTIKYLEIDTQTREEQRIAWNKPYVKPILLVLVALLLLSLPAVWVYWRKMHQAKPRYSLEAKE